MTPIRPFTVKTSLLVAAGLLIGLAGRFAPAAAVELAPSQIQAQVAAYVKESLQAYISQNDQAYITVDAVLPPYANLNFPKAQEVSAVKISMESSLAEVYSDRAIVRLHMEGPGGARRDIGVPVRITVKKPVWVVKTAVNAQRPLRQSDFVLQAKDVSYLYRYAVGQEAILGDYVARVNLQPGEVLDTRKIAIPPDINYNANVLIMLSNNSGMTLTVPGVAMANGRIGDTIRVRQSVYQSRYYNAKIIDKSRVLVAI